MSTSSTNKETTFMITTIVFGSLSGLLGVILMCSLMVMSKVHKEVIILKSKHTHIDTVTNESYAVFKGIDGTKLYLGFRCCKG